jgi:hypothetical protein
MQMPASRAPVRRSLPVFVVLGIVPVTVGHVDVAVVIRRRRSSKYT